MSENKIPIILCQRNPLDVHISNLKHKESSAKGHCKIGDKTCIETHKKFTTSLNLNMTLHYLKMFEIKHHQIKILLIENNINFKEFTFEDLFFSPNKLETWTNLLQFLDYKFNRNMTENDIKTKSVSL